MAQLKDLIVDGSSRIIGNLFTSKLQSRYFHLPTTSGGTTKSVGSNGQVVKSNGTTSYWGNTK